MREHVHALVAIDHTARGIVRFAFGLIRPLACGARGIMAMRHMRIVAAVSVRGRVIAAYVRACDSAGQPARHDEQSNQKEAQNLSRRSAHGVSKPEDLDAVKAHSMRFRLP